MTPLSLITFPINDQPLVNWSISDWNEQLLDRHNISDHVQRMVYLQLAAQYKRSTMCSPTLVNYSTNFNLAIWGQCEPPSLFFNVMLKDVFSTFLKIVHTHSIGIKQVVSVEVAPRWYFHYFVIFFFVCVSMSMLKPECWNICNLQKFGQRSSQNSVCLQCVGSLFKNDRF